MRAGRAFVLGLVPPLLVAIEASAQAAEPSPDRLTIGLGGAVGGGFLVFLMMAVRRRLAPSHNASNADAEGNESDRDGLVSGYREIIALAPFPLMEIASDGHFVYMNADGERQFGFSVKGWRGTRWSDLLHPDDHDRLTDMFDLRLRGERSHLAPLRLRCPDGWRWFGGWSQSYETDDGERRLLAAAWDITSDHQAAEALRVSEERFRSFADNSPDMIAECDDQARFTYLNPAYQCQLGFAPEELLGTNSLDLVPPEERDFARSTFAGIVTSGGAAQVERGVLRIRDASGDLRCLDVRGSTYKRENGQRYVVLSARDITQQVDLAEARERLVTLLQHSHDFVAIADPAGQISFLNSSGRRLVGIDEHAEISAYRIVDLVPEEYQSLLMDLIIPAVMRNGEFSGTFSLLHLQKRNWIPVQLESAAVWDPAHQTHVAVGFILRDLRPEQSLRAERDQLISKLGALDKLETVGVVAGGIAHDFNSLLAVVLGNISIARNEAPRAGIDDLLNAAEQAALRASDVIRRLLAYVGRSSLETQHFTLGDVARECAVSRREQQQDGVHVEWDLSEPGPVLVGDPAQARQIFDHLLDNALEAVSPGGGTVEIGTTERILRREEIETLRLPLEALPGTFSCLEVRDSGPGIEPSVLRRAFDPFFTTKAVGRGLGLAAVMGIARVAGGAIDVKSQPGSGTTVRVFLPSAGHERRAAAELPWRAARSVGSVLVMERASDFLLLLERSLERNGYDMIHAKDADELLVRFRDLQGQVAAVILDLELPAARGLDVLREIRLEQADLTIVISLTRGEEAVAQELVGDDVAFLMKPWAPDALLAILEEVHGRAPREVS